MGIKRTFDVVVVLLAALVWLPVVLLTALLVLVATGRPVLYRSDRWVGVRRRIEMVKFRVMVPHAENSRVGGPSNPQDHFLNHPGDSPLYTRVGRFLERWGLTELPQFFHVLGGSMSVVGARPLTDAVKDALVHEYGAVDQRFATPAGLTGPPQLVGRDQLSADERLHLEAAYCHAARHGYRLRLDFLVLLYTVLIVLHLKRPMSYTEALGLVHRHSRGTTEQVAPVRRRRRPGPESVPVD